MNAIELFTKEGKPAGVFYCEKCKLVRKTKEEADQCCKPLICQCGTVIEEKYWASCQTCRRKAEAEREQARFEKAEKVTEWDGWIYAESIGYNEGYFRDLEELEDYLACEGDIDRPEYVWTCSENQFCQLDYHSIIENATQDAYEDWEPDSINGEAEFKAAIDKFNEANTEHISYQPNYKKALILPAQAQEEKQ